METTKANDEDLYFILVYLFIFLVFFRNIFFRTMQWRQSKKTHGVPCFGIFAKEMAPNCDYLKRVVRSAISY